MKKLFIRKIIHVFMPLFVFAIIYFTYNNNYANNVILPFGRVTDIDGNTYNTLKIGRQEWMLDNLNVSRYQNGDPIINITDYDKWNYSTIGAWSYYENNKKKYEKIYGKLYNWYAVNDKRGLAPKGWHIPSSDEWKELNEYLGGEMMAGTLIKTYSRLSHLRYGEGEGWDPIYFFSGSRYLSGAFCFTMYHAYFWTISRKDNIQSRYIRLSIYDSMVYNDYNFNNVGMSVRCIKDANK